MFIRLPSDAVPPQLLRRARLSRVRAAILGSLLHGPLVVGVVALFEGRFLIAAIAIALHLCLSLGAPPAFILLPAFPVRFVASIGRTFLTHAHRTFLLFHLASLFVGLALGALLWAVLWAG